MTGTPLRCVVDASVGIKLLIDEPDSTRVDELFAHLADDPSAELYVPDLFYVECANIFWKYMRRAGSAVPPDGQNLERLCSLALISVPTQELAPEALALALRYDITAYDACYVTLAQVEHAPLVTADERLVRKLVGSPHAAQLLGTFVIPPPP